MKYSLFLLIPICAITLALCKSNCDPLDFNFGNSKWHFPSTIENATIKHQLNYKPPGYYYNIDSSGMEVLLDYHFEGGDFYNENQPKETLYARHLHSYIFRFDEKVGIYDSLRRNLEKTYQIKFVLTKGLKDGETLKENERPFEYDFLTVNPCLTIGITSSPASKKTDRKVVVRFMYNLSLGRMGVAMSNYL